MGKGTKQAQKDVSDELNIISIQVETNLTIQLHICQTYKHLGIKTTAKGSMGSEVKTKDTWFHEHITKNMRKMFKSATLDLEYKKQLLQCIMLTGIMYGSSTWLHLTKQEEDKMHAIIMRCYRLLNT